jgi:hypothetical protein
VVLGLAIQMLTIKDNLMMRHETISIAILAIISYLCGRVFFAEMFEMLTEVGFKDIEKRSLAGPAEIVIGYK